MALKTKWKNQFVTLGHNSDFHNSVGLLFRTSPFFKMLKCFQEVPVADLIESYPFSGQRYDWYIEELHTIVELHGAQHYKATNWGNTSYEQIQSDFRKGQQRDAAKKAAALEAGLKYVEISYKHYGKLTEELLKQLILG